MTGLFCDRPRAGRPRSFTDRDARRVKFNAARNVVMSAADVARDLNKCRHNISYALRSAHFRPFSDKNVPFVNKNYKKHRKALYDQLEKVDWENVIYSDEKSFSCHPDGRVKIYARTSEEHYRKRQNLSFRGRFTCRVWGAISSRGTGRLIFLKGPWNSRQYVNQVLQPALCDRRAILKLHNSRAYLPKRWRFQQDNDPAHRGGPAMDFFHQHHIPLLRWPPRSPDLNPIEHIWSFMVRKIREEQVRVGGTWNEQRLKSAISAAWSNVTPELCKRLCNSVPMRLKSIKKHGWLAIM